MNETVDTILVVEDMPQIRGLLEATLRFEGYSVESASDGEEALKMIDQNPPALIITDILMPRMDGFAMVYRLRKQEATRDIPVVFLSATYVTKEDKDFALSLGALRFMEKPVETSDLLLTIGEILAGTIEKPPSDVNERDFYLGYRRRLENKLRQKNSQITRTKNLLKTLPDPQKKAFESLLAESEVHREQILQELEEIIQGLRALEDREAGSETDQDS